MLIKMNIYGETLISRIEGKKIREQALKSIANKEKVVLDFDGISRITQSFGDELFGKMLYDISIEDFKRDIKIKNVSREIKTIIKYCIELRYK